MLHQWDHQLHHHVPPAQVQQLGLILFRIVCFVYKYDMELYIDKYFNDVIDKIWFNVIGFDNIGYFERERENI